MLQISNLILPVDGGEDLLRQKAARVLGVRPGDILRLSLHRQSIDARKKNDVHLVCTVRLTLNKEDAALRRAPRGVTEVAEAPYALPPLNRASSLPPVVVGMGPAGLFAALTLARAGLRTWSAFGEPAGSPPSPTSSLARGARARSPTASSPPG